MSAVLSRESCDVFVEYINGWVDGWMGGWMNTDTLSCLQSPSYLLMGYWISMGCSLRKQLNELILTGNPKFSNQLCFRCSFVNWMLKSKVLYHRDTITTGGYNGIPNCWIEAHCSVSGLKSRRKKWSHITKQRYARPVIKTKMNSSVSLSVWGEGTWVGEGVIMLRIKQILL